MVKFFSFLALAFACGSLHLNAQTVDSVVLGSGYVNNVYYSFSGSQTSSPMANWDIAFENQGYTSSVLANTAKGLAVWSVPGSNGDSFDSAIDTTAVFAQPQLLNSITSWSNGAFNMGKDENNDSDFGWGVYNVNNHFVTASKVFVVKLANKQIKKLIIDALGGGEYSFRYTNIDGSDLQTKTVKKSDFSGKNFGYFSMESGTSIDREPAKWDLFFGKYTTMVGSTVYNVTGVLTNKSVKTAVYKGGSQKTATSEGLTFEENIGTIGFNWKSFNGTSYVVSDSLAYFVQTADGKITRIVFTAFDLSTGYISFESQALSSTSVEENGSLASSVALYPNPSNGNATALFSTAITGAPVEFSVWDILGNKVQNVVIPAESNLMQYDITGLSSGVYMVTVTVNGHTSSQKLVIQ